MHQQAILTTNNPTLGPPGSLISITTIEGHYSTTSQANSGIGYKCANPNCGVAVMAIITKHSKARRKNSPSSYFRAKKSHIKGCDREPKPGVVTTPPTSGGQGSASPNRTKAPAIWVDPRSKMAQGPGTSVPPSNGNSTGTTYSSGRSPHGSGTSQGRAQMVETFSRHWLNMTPAQKASEALTASWNPGGTYASAFYELPSIASVNVGSLDEHIFVGELDRVFKGSTGYSVTLKEKNNDRGDLLIWVQDPTFQHGRAGGALLTQLQQLAAKSKNSRIFALGKFVLQHATNGKRQWHSIAINHPHLLWIF